MIFQFFSKINENSRNYLYLIGKEDAPRFSILHIRSKTMNESQKALTPQEKWEQATIANNFIFYKVIRRDKPAVLL